MPTSESPASIRRTKLLGTLKANMPSSALHMSATSPDMYDHSKDCELKSPCADVLQGKATPPRINTPMVTSPACKSPSLLIPRAEAEPSLLTTSLKVPSEPLTSTPDPSCPISNACTSEPVSPVTRLPSSGLLPRRVNPHVESSWVPYTPLMLKRTHPLATSSRTSDVVCTPPRPTIQPIKITSEVLSTDTASTTTSPQCSSPSLKSSTGLSILRSPRIAKEYLLAHLSKKSDTPLTRTTSVRRGSLPSTSRCDSPNMTRKLSEPLPIQYDRTQRETLKGSCDTISMPYNVTHTTHADHRNLKMSGGSVVMTNSNEPIYEKAGYLHKLAGNTFKERWFECRRSTLSYYSNKDSSKPRREIYLSDCEFERDNTCKRQYTVRLVHTPTKKPYYLAASDAISFEDWVHVLHSSGATDKDLVIMEKGQQKREKKEEEARKAKDLKKEEDEYVREKIKKRSTLRITNKNMGDCQMEVCLCTITVQGIVEKGNGQEFKINIMFDDQKWTVFRNFDKVAKMYDAMTKLKFIKGMCPPRKCPASMKEVEFIQLQISKLQNLFDLLVRNRPCVLANTVPRQKFLRFIAPVGWDDVKPEEFVMPFQFDF